MGFSPNFPPPMPSEMDSGHQDPHPPGTTISVTPYTAPFPPRSITPPPPKQTLVTLHNRKKEDPTVTESITITIHERVTFTEKEFLTRTDTVYINQTIFIHDTVTHTSTKPILTLNPTPVRMTVTTTNMLTPTGTGKCNPFAAAAQGFDRPSTITPIPSSNDNKPNGPVIAGAVVSSLLGLALVMGAAWFGIRKWRAWKAKRNGHMKGVELQRRWEREQEMRAREGGDV